MADKSAILKEIEACGVVAVVRADSMDEAAGAARALLRGGVRGIEITFTVPGAAQTIARLAEEAAAGNLEGDLLLGAGTVVSVEQTEDALAAGAQFLVSPCVVPEVIRLAKSRGVVMLPGALTPTEIWTAHSMGGDIIKVFPASRFGPAYFKDIKGPFPDIPLLPTGGVDANNAGEWIKAGAVALGVGGKLVDRAAIKAGDWDTLTARASELMQAVRAAREAE
ncbi:MAG: bifunctional 4-hydroxy-2-oxoglutarate aldolase/2-dehydro-3-deoxy-phosphogluconate aldolase [Armatimonadota bacterium]|nr:bifunctional 4-hydroxy-2-oxoglutarate aldolase/2-dehydro-3-deoxy-phosphogluconate aldolase [Armatimonadota bacterium]